MQRLQQDHSYVARVHAWPCFKRIELTEGLQAGKGGWLLLLLLFANVVALAQSPGWPQWGGPQRNFMVDAKGLAAAWPADGPKRLWSRELGGGHSSIIDRKMIVALDLS